MTSSRPQKINENGLRRLGNRAVFFDFGGLNSIKLFITQQIVRVAAKMNFDDKQSPNGEEGAEGMEGGEGGMYRFKKKVRNNGLQMNRVKRDQSILDDILGQYRFKQSRNRNRYNQQQQNKVRNKQQQQNKVRNKQKVIDSDDSQFYQYRFKQYGDEGMGMEGEEGQQNNPLMQKEQDRKNEIERCKKYNDKESKLTHTVKKNGL